ncbi:hypothetical protein HNP84_009781 [Thermocatellispora tengchongensis]|uniref:Uncharacterized protein n=1 Tax=Thermocatellispora tengchongensis TaxID=1073253 RepID=A0A840PM86_9ACTN|nr:hypothetical protein [Thermocatellispora tengchongensis]MBB5140016.1 hypothetical protein [Thermocatellispora tengchongensis]
MPTKPTRREARQMRFHARIKGAPTPKEAFHEAVRYLTAELADIRNADEAEGDRLYTHYAAEFRRSGDDTNRQRR